MSTTKSEIALFALKSAGSKTFSSFSYDDVAREFNMTKAAVHYHFKNKEDLGVALCETFRNMLLESRTREIEAARGGRHPWLFVEAMFKSLPAGGICPIVSLQADYENLPERVRAALTELTTVEIETLRLLTRAYDEKVDFDTVLPQLLSLKGALQYRRVMGEKFFQKALKSIKALFYAAIPKRG